ncbi:MAG TPA: acyl-CoA dehydrogenase family protein [Casimicrobiaceae bacterium]|nr:acyl-CoA dehydrogenase family protein [Casimicrobiaceae bacterium]
MDFTYTDEQRELAASIRRFFERHYDFTARHRIVASDPGWSRDAWAHLAELGVLALPLPEDCDGYGGRAVDLVPFMQSAGEALLVEPYVATVALCARMIARGGSPAQRGDMLAAIAAGKLVMAFAHGERHARYRLCQVETRARKVGDGYVIDGDKRVVLGAPCANALIVSARLSGDACDESGIALFVVDVERPDVRLRSYRTLDESRAADVTLSGVTLPESARLGDEAFPLIEDAVDYATALTCAEACGAIKSANDATLEYVKTRKQFGVPIGSFQALQHRLVDMYIEGEQALSMALLACTAVDEESDPVQRKRLVSAAKIRIAQACRRVSQEAIQLHGGMGMSDEMKVSHTFRRLTMIAQQFGDIDHHLERFAACEAAEGVPR